MNKRHLKWICNGNPDSEVWDASEYFDTKEDAICEGKKALRAYLANPEEDYDQYDVLGVTYDLDIDGTPTGFAVAQFVCPSFGIDAESIIESLQEDAYSEGGEFSEGYLDDVTQEQQEELEEQLNAILDAWMDKYNHHPNFYNVADIKIIRLEM